MSAVINIAELRSEISKIVTSDPKKFSWALNLPETTLDAYALEMLSKNAESPMGLLEKLNPFAIQEQLSAVTRLFGVIAQIRAECFTLEAQLYSEIYAESLAEDSAAAAMKLQQLATSADWVTSKQNGQPDQMIVPKLFELQASLRATKRILRGTKGHPLNLLERIEDVRKRYVNDLGVLLAKSEVVVLTLTHSFGYSAPSLLKSYLSGDATYEKGDNPGPLIHTWLTNLSIELESRSSSEQVITWYRLLKGDSWVSDDVTGKLNQSGDALFEFDLDDTRLGFDSKYALRIVGVGAVPTFLDIGGFPSDNAANTNTAFHQQLRAIRRQVSFDVVIEFPSVVWDRDGNKINYPSASILLNGVEGWGTGVGPSSSAVSLKTNAYITNRPARCKKLRLTVLSHVRTNRGLTTRQAYPGANVSEDMKMDDVLFAIQFVVSPIST